MITVCRPTRAATEWTVWSTTARLVVEPAADATGILNRARAVADRELAAIDAAVNRRRPDCELSLVAGSLPYGVIVSPELAMFVRRAVDAATPAGESGGHPWRRGIRMEEVSMRDPGLPGAPVVTGTRLTVSGDVLLDLGATAESVAADLVAHAVADELGVPALFALGDSESRALPRVSSTQR